MRRYNGLFQLAAPRLHSLHSKRHEPKGRKKKRNCTESRLEGTDGFTVLYRTYARQGGAEGCDPRLFVGGPLLITGERGGGRERPPPRTILRESANGDGYWPASVLARRDRRARILSLVYYWIRGPRRTCVCLSAAAAATAAVAVCTRPCVCVHVSARLCRGPAIVTAIAPTSRSRLRFLIKILPSYGRRDYVAVGIFRAALVAPFENNR